MCTSKVEPEEFGRIAQAAFDRFGPSSHPVFRALLHHQLLVSLVLANQYMRRPPMVAPYSPRRWLIAAQWQLTGCRPQAG